MTCTLPIYGSTGTVAYSIPASASGRLTIHQGGGLAYEVANVPAVPADQGGQLPVYSGGAVLYTIPFVCPATPLTGTKSGGSSGGASGVTALEGGVSTTGSAFGRLF